MMNAKSAQEPVVLVHGIDDTAASLATMASYLTARGWPVSSFDLVPSNGRGGIPQLADQLKAHIAVTYPPDTPLNLVAFSLGGVVARYYLQRLDGLARVRRFVSISSPHHGTLMGWLRWNLGGQQLRPGSALLADLNHDVSTLARIDCTCIRTPFDLMIIPSTSSRLPNAREVVIPVLLHPWMLTDPRVLADVAEALTREVGFSPDDTT